VSECTCEHEAGIHGVFGCQMTIGYSESLSNLGGIKCRCSAKGGAA
jgi:hypothetical protein